MRIRFVLAAAAAALPISLAFAQPSEPGAGSAINPVPPANPPVTDAPPTPVSPGVLPASPNQDAPAPATPSAKGDVSANVFQHETSTSPAVSPNAGAITEAPQGGAKAYPPCTRTRQDACTNAGESKKRGRKG